MSLNFEKLLNNTVDGIFILNREGEFIFYNRACDVLYDLSRQDLANQALMKFAEFEKLELKDTPETDESIFMQIQGHKDRKLLNRNNGNSVWVEINYIPVLDKEHDGILYVFGLIKDLTELKQLENENKTLRDELSKVRESLAKNFNFSNIVGKSPEIIKSLELASLVAEEDTSVMLLGESGTGKELFAKAIHNNSSVRKGPFVAVNCSAFPDTLIESELFGYEKGAFTGADGPGIGKVAQAEGGTLFLDEVAELSMPAQAKILRLVQENEYQPLGNPKVLKANVRFITATHQDLKGFVKEGKFREDLFYRFFVYPVSIPPLRERKQDIPILVDYFIKNICEKLGKGNHTITDEALALLTEYPWPGNVRELQNVLERALILCKEKQINEQDLPINLNPETKTGTGLNSLSALPQGVSLENYKNQWEAQIILQTLEECNGNKAKTARALGITRSALRYKLEKIKQDEKE